MAIELSELKKSPEKKLLNSLVREVIKGKTYYYKGYKEVITGIKQVGEITGSNSIQAVLATVLGYFIKSRLDKTKYFLATNEAGLHLEHHSNFSTDLGIFLKENVKPSIQYFQIAPEVGIELDVRIDTRNDSDYIFAKSSVMM